MPGISLVIPEIGFEIREFCEGKRVFFMMKPLNGPVPITHQCVKRHMIMRPSSLEK